MINGSGNWLVCLFHRNVSIMQSCIGQAVDLYLAIFHSGIWMIKYDVLEWYSNMSVVMLILK